MPSKIKLHESQDRRKTEDKFLLKGGGGGGGLDFGLNFFGGLNQKIGHDQYMQNPYLH